MIDGLIRIFHFSQRISSHKEPIVKLIDLGST